MATELKDIPGREYPIIGDRNEGYFGTVHSSELPDMVAFFKDEIKTYPSPDNITKDTPWYKFAWKGKIIFTTSRSQFNLSSKEQKQEYFSMLNKKTFKKDKVNYRLKNMEWIGKENPTYGLLSEEESYKFSHGSMYNRLILGLSKNAKYQDWRNEGRIEKDIPDWKVNLEYEDLIYGDIRDRYTSDMSTEPVDYYVDEKKEDYFVFYMYRLSKTYQTIDLTSSIAFGKTAEAAYNKNIGDYRNVCAYSILEIDDVVWNHPPKITLSMEKNQNNLLPSHYYKVTGEVYDQQNQLATLSYSVNDGPFSTSTRVKNGNFEIKVPVYKMIDGENVISIKASDGEDHSIEKIKVNREAFRAPSKVGMIEYKVEPPEFCDKNLFLWIFKENKKVNLSVSVSTNDGEFMPARHINTLKNKEGEGYVYVYEYTYPEKPNNVSFRIDLDRDSLDDESGITKIKGVFN